MSTITIASMMIQYLDNNFQADIIENKDIEAINEMVNSLKSLASDYITQMLLEKEEEVTESRINGFIYHVADNVFELMYNAVMDSTLASYEYELRKYEDLEVQYALLDEVGETLEATEGYDDFGEDYARQLLYNYYIVKFVGIYYIDEWVAYISSPEDY